MVRKIFCDDCGRELTASEIIQIFDRDLCKTCSARINRKNGKNKPKIVRRFGKEDKLIKDYLEVYNESKDF